MRDQIALRIVAHKNARNRLLFAKYLASGWAGSAPIVSLVATGHTGTGAPAGSWKKKSFLRRTRPQIATTLEAILMSLADSGNNTIRKITPAAKVTTFAGSAGLFGNTDGTGTAARFNGALGVAVDHSGNVFVTDTGNNTIRKITPTRVVTTLGGLALSPGTSDGAGINARFNDPRGIAVDSAGNIYVGDTSNHTIRLGTP